jgi:DNA replication protein DnaC
MHYRFWGLLDSCLAAEAGHDPDEQLRRRAEDLHLYGVLAHWHKLADSVWLEPLLTWEETERARRSLERRLGSAHIGRFKPIADFDWNWPEQCDRTAVSELLSLDFLKTAANAIMVGTSDLGKSTLAQNIAHQAVLRGHTVLFTTAGQLLGDLANRRHEQKSTLVTTNKSFAEWSEVFPYRQAGSRYFCERYLGVLPKNQQKLRDRYAFGCPSRPGHSFATHQGVAHLLSNDSTRCRKACIFTTQKDAS